MCDCECLQLHILWLCSANVHGRKWIDISAAISKEFIQRYQPNYECAIMRWLAVNVKFELIGVFFSILEILPDFREFVLVWWINVRTLEMNFSFSGELIWLWWFVLFFFLSGPAGFVCFCLVAAHRQIEWLLWNWTWVRNEVRWTGFCLPTIIIVADWVRALNAVQWFFRVAVDSSLRAESGFLRAAWD